MPSTKSYRRKRYNETCGGNTKKRQRWGIFDRIGKHIEIFDKSEEKDSTEFDRTMTRKEIIKANIGGVKGSEIIEYEVT